MLSQALFTCTRSATTESSAAPIACFPEKKQLKKVFLQALKHKSKFSTGWCPAHSNLSRCEDLMLAPRSCTGISPGVLLSLLESKTSSSCYWGHGYSKQSWLLKIQKTICPWNRCSCPPLGKKEIKQTEVSQKPPAGPYSTEQQKSPTSTFWALWVPSSLDTLTDLCTSVLYLKKWHFQRHSERRAEGD